MQNTMSIIRLYLFRSFIIVAMLCFVGLVQAKTVYINDQLRVGIRPEPNNDSAPLGVVVTGDELELLDNNSGYVMVRTKDGVEGWIKEIYTTTKVPAIVQLKALSQSSGGAGKKIQELTKQIGIIESANEALNKELELAKDEKSKIRMQLFAIKGGQPSTSWVYWLSALILFTVTSFVLGMFWYRNKAMKRLGGLRIYF